MFSFQPEPHEFEKARAVADESTANHRRLSILPNPLVSKKGEDAVTLTGALGEVAFCRWLGMPLSEIKPAVGGDPGWDFERNGCRIEVRTTLGKDRNLLHPAHKPIRWTHAVLVWHEEPLVHVVGWCSREEFERSAKPRNFGSPSLCLSWRRLHPARAPFGPPAT